GQRVEDQGGVDDQEGATGLDETVGRLVERYMITGCGRGECLLENGEVVGVGGGDGEVVVRDDTTVNRHDDERGDHQAQPYERSDPSRRGGPVARGVGRRCRGRSGTHRLRLRWTTRLRVGGSRCSG